MSVVQFPKKRKWDAEDVFDCLEIVKDAMHRRWGDVLLWRKGNEQC